jgi:hypothetical protein
MPDPTSSVFNRFTGRIERMDRVREAAYHAALCVYDVYDPKASAGRKRRARKSLEYYGVRLPKEAQ